MMTEYYDLPKGNKLQVNFEVDSENLTDNELRFLFLSSFNRIEKDFKSVVEKISNKYHLDYIDWDREKNKFIVTVCKNTLTIK